MLELKVKKLDPEAILPNKSYKGDAGMDLYSIEDIAIHPGQQVEVRTGIAIEIPEGYHLQIHTRSSYGKKSIRCHLGIIDEGYRNEITIWIVFPNVYCIDGDKYILREPYEIKKGDKICQMVLLPVPEVEIVETEELSNSERGLKGHGSSGR